MNLLKYISIGIVLVGAITGCGKNTVETLMVPAQVDPNGRGKGMSVVILPFADYSNGDNIASAFRRNVQEGCLSGATTRCAPPTF